MSRFPSAAEIKQRVTNRKVDRLAEPIAELVGKYSGLFPDVGRVQSDTFAVIPGLEYSMAKRVAARVLSKLDPTLAQSWQYNREASEVVNFASGGVGHNHGRHPLREQVVIFDRVVATDPVLEVLPALTDFRQPEPLTDYEAAA